MKIDVREVSFAIPVSNTTVIERPEIADSGTATGRGEWIVTVYNNDYNTYDQVIGILVVATRCSMDEASMETWEVDHLGQSVVHQASEEECRKVASVISTIGIRVDVTKED
ncbi:MAG: hypothetical protein HONBIEJF_01215 [Fimbriimonadaceae bacterium]|nr:hypothetical protein [Fimbriimonadaceae bacterium]